MVATNSDGEPTLTDHISMDDEEASDFEPDRLNLRTRSAKL